MKATSSEPVCVAKILDWVRERVEHPDVTLDPVPGGPRWQRWKSLRETVELFRTDESHLRGQFADNLKTQIASLRSEKSRRDLVNECLFAAYANCFDRKPIASPRG